MSEAGIDQFQLGPEFHHKADSTQDGQDFPMWVLKFATFESQNH